MAASSQNLINMIGFLTLTRSDWGMYFLSCKLEIIDKVAKERVLFGHL